jgi:hypothetical protein
MKISVKQLRQIIRECLAEQAWVPGRWDPSNGEPYNPEDVDLMTTGGLGHAPHEELEEAELDEDDLEEDFASDLPSPPDPLPDLREDGLWDNIRARREKGLPRLKPGQEGYPKTLNVGKKKEGVNEALFGPGKKAEFVKATPEEISRKWPDFFAYVRTKLGKDIDRASFAVDKSGFLSRGVPYVAPANTNLPVISWNYEDEVPEFNGSISLSSMIKSAK